MEDGSARAGGCARGTLMHDIFEIMPTVKHPRPCPAGSAFSSYAIASCGDNKM